MDFVFHKLMGVERREEAAICEGEYGYWSNPNLFLNGIEMENAS